MATKPVQLFMYDGEIENWGGCSHLLAREGCYPQKKIMYKKTLYKDVSQENLLVVLPEKDAMNVSQKKYMFGR